MSKNLEKEYKQMMEDLSPDLWDRIEAGVNASPRANNVLTFDSVSTERQTEKSPSKIRNFYQYRALAGVAACFVLLMIAVPTVRSSMLREKQDSKMASIVIDGSESTADSSNVTGKGSFTTEGTVFDEAQPEAVASDESVYTEETAETAEAAVPATPVAEATTPKKEPAAVAENATVAATTEVAEAADTAEVSAADHSGATEEVAEETVANAAEDSQAVSDDEGTAKEEGKVSTAKEDSKVSTAKEDGKVSTAKEDSKTTAAKTTTSSSSKIFKKPVASGVKDAAKQNLTTNHTTAGAIAKPLATTYDNINVKIQSTQNDDGTILYTAVVTSKGGAIAEGTTIILQIANPSVGKLAEMKEYTISCKDEGFISSSGATVYSVTSIADVVADLGEDADNC